MRRVFDPAELNAMAWRDDVFPHIAQAGMRPEQMDFTVPLSNQRNICIEHKGALFFLECMEDGVYEIHTFAPPKFGVRPLFMGVCGEMFLKTEAVEIFTRTPACHDRAITGLEKLGLRRLFERPDCWATQDGRCGLITWSLPALEWMTSTGVPEAGHLFHEQMNQQGVDPQHEDWDVHDRVVGAALTMIRNGFFDKGMTLYNRWARVAGYMPLRVEPLVNVGNAVISISDDKVTVK